MELNGKQIRHLRAMAHHLQPMVQIGANRVTEGVIKHVDHALELRELVKARLIDADKAEVREARDTLCARTGAVHVQTIGHTLILFRRRRKDPEIVLPGERILDVRGKRERKKLRRRR